MWPHKRIQFLIQTTKPGGHYVTFCKNFNVVSASKQTKTYDILTMLYIVICDTPCPDSFNYYRGLKRT